jgi:hypothetical protein
MEYDYLRLKFQGEALSKFANIENWYPVSFLGVPGICKIPKIHIVSIGPMGMRLVITPDHIILPSTILGPADWYSPENKEKVMAWRNYYYAIIKLFYGDHALYVEERTADNHYRIVHKPKGASLGIFEDYLVSRYGTPEKSMFDYPQGKFPKYYIDIFSDIKRQGETGLA